MQPSAYNALLLIADISGFTQFMKSYKEAANHAMPVKVVVELLRAVISAATRPSGTLKLAEVEGDAAFFYAICWENGDSKRELAVIKEQVMSFFRTFHQTLHRLCTFNPCALKAQDLRLKVIIHAGEVAIEHIHGFDKLFGMDVILAHRLLKNSVPSQEYVLMTEAAHDRLGDFYPWESERQTEYCEGIGFVQTVINYPPAQFICDAKKQGEKFQADGGQRLPGVDPIDESRDRFWAQPINHLSSEQFQFSAGAQMIKPVWVAQLRTKWRHDDVIHVRGHVRQEFGGGHSP